MSRHLTSVDQLELLITDDSARVIDCRWYLGEPDEGHIAYREGHIPGAIYASLDSDLSGPTGPGRHPLPSPEAFAATLARLGITAATPVVAYDDRGGSVAARLWWMLTAQGHANASVLDGGIQAWVSAGNPVSRTETTTPRGDYPTGPWAGVIDRETVVARPAGAVLIDARGTERYRGDEEPVDPKAGHIPGAVSLPQTDNLTADLVFLDGDQLRRRFDVINDTDIADVIVHCGSGVTACHNILGMEVAGLGRATLYVGSWSDWSSTDLPVATGDSP